jgi:tetratricopeptide (TPR) repeat protein
MPGRPIARSLLALAAVVLLVPRPAQGQATESGRVDLWLLGTVTDGGGGPVAGARVEIHLDREHRGAPLAAGHTDAAGRYRLLLRNGARRHRVTVTAPGHQTYTRVLQPLALPYATGTAGDSPLPAGRAEALELRFDVVLASEEAVVARARADGGRGAVPAAELRYAATVLHNRGLVAARFDDLAWAEELLREASRLDPELLAARVSLAKVLHDRGETEEFLELAAAARAAGARDPEVELLACAVLEREGREAEIEPVLAVLRREDPAAAARCLHRLAVGLANIGFDERADRHLEEALELAPRDVETLYLAGVVAARRGDVDRAAAHLEALLAVEPAGPRAEPARELLAGLAAAAPASGP